MPDLAHLRMLANECVNLVAAGTNVQLDWTRESMEELDAVCVELLEDGPLEGERFDLWFQLIGAYTGEVVVRAYGGEWVDHESSPGAPAVRALGVTAFPFGVAAKILDGEPYKSLASFVRALPVVAERSREP